MKQKLSAINLLWISLTSMIGSGWLFGSLYSAHFAGPAAIMAWPIAGLLLLFVAFSYAEIATIFPKENTLTYLPLYTHGYLTSIMVTGLSWISSAAIPMIETQGLIQYASNYFPHLMMHHGLHYTTTTLGYSVTLILLISFVLINYFGIRFFARINTSFTIWKLIIPTITVIALLSVNYHGSNFYAYGGFIPYGWKGVMAAMSTGGVLFSLLGFRQVIIMMNEIENPQKYVPLILISSILLTTLLYSFLQWSFICSIHPQDLVHGWKNLAFPGDAGPFAALATSAGLLWLSGLLYIDAFISPYSTGLVYSTTSAYLLSSMGALGYAPEQLMIKNKYQVPWISLLVDFLLAAMLFFLLKDWQEMSAFLVAVLMMTYGIGPICLVSLRKQLPNYTRPFYLKCGKSIAFIGFYVCTAGIYWSGLRSIIKLLGLTMIGLLLYFMYRIIKKKSYVLDIKHSLWLFCYFFSLAIFSYLGNFGGKHLIPAYWDLGFLMVISFIIFGFAIISRKSGHPTQINHQQEKSVI